MTEKPNIKKGVCPRCVGSRNAKVVGEHVENWSDDDAGVSGGETHRILKCAGCDEVYIQKESWFSEDLEIVQDPITGKHDYFVPSTYDYWPKVSLRAKPAWRAKIATVDVELFGLMGELYQAHDNQLPVLTAIGVRTAFDRASELLGVSPDKSFAQKLKELEASGKVGATEQSILSTLTDAGSAAAHRAWRPTQEELDVMMDMIESFLHRNFVLDGAAKKLQNAVPARKKKKP